MGWAERNPSFFTTWSATRWVSLPFNPSYGLQSVLITIPQVLLRIICGQGSMMNDGTKLLSLCHRVLLALWIAGASSTSALARDLNVTSVAPLQRAKADYLDKANGLGPRFQFVSAPPELPSSCAASVTVNVNDADFVDYPGERTSEEFRSKAAASTQLDPSEAEQASIHTPYTLKGQNQISNAMCTNLFAGANARGFCTGTISGSSYTIVYHFDPVACRYDNVAVGKAVEARLSVDNRNDQEPELNCATKLKEFVDDIDAVLARNPHNILDVFDVLNRHFPLRGCTVDVVSSIIKTSKYFRSMGTNGPKMYVFVLNSETPYSRGVKVIFGVTATGNSSLPSAGWSPPFP